jgi:hypothetical protein
MRKWLVKHGYASPKQNIGVFSNIGQWNSSEHIHSSDDRTIWLFCPPVWHTQKFAAGCVTFQNRLSLTIQAHPTLTTSCSTMENVMDCWVSEIHKVIREEDG